MAKIRAEDVVEVRERARIDEVVRDSVALKPAGGGSYKGLCPFHEERSPSFQVSPSKGLWYCFGCGEGGDTIDFVMRTEALSFAEAVEKLAGRYGVQLRYEEGGGAPGRMQGQRTRLVAANAAAAEFFIGALGESDARIGRDFLAARGFDDAAIELFGVGFAPKSWDALTTRLRRAGISDEDQLAAGLLSTGQRGTYDRFRGRLIWPIRDLAGDVVGFGARKLFDDDQGPKYLNTPETPLYKKSNVLYGVDLARRSIATGQQAVIVEGYTDVMACHLAGVTTAVATCGTSFGDGHVKILRRLLFDDDAMAGEIVFTFDGDAAGQRAAMRALESDQSFVAQTYVAVEPSGMDPCDLRLSGGDEAVRALVGAKVPMVEFAMRTKLAEFDLDTAEGRVAGLRATAPLVNSIRDVALRTEYTSQLAGWTGMDRAAVQGAIRQQKPAQARRERPAGTDQQPPVAQPRSAPRRDPDHSDPRLERQALQVMLQLPYLVAGWIADTEETAFNEPMLVQVFRCIQAAGEPAGDAAGAARVWLDAVMAAAPDDEVRSEIRRWAVLGLPVGTDGDVSAYAQGIMAQLHAWDAARRITPLKGRLARIDSVREPEEFNALMTSLMELEAYRREMQALAVGDS